MNTILSRIKASMGPRHFCRGIPESRLRRARSFSLLQWGHGISAVESFQSGTGGVTINRCFNGATAFLPWNPGERANMPVRLSELQWGHGISAVESAFFPGTD